MSIYKSSQKRQRNGKNEKRKPDHDDLEGRSCSTAVGPETGDDSAATFWRMSRAESFKTRFICFIVTLVLTQDLVIEPDRDERLIFDALPLTTSQLNRRLFAEAFNNCHCHDLIVLLASFFLYPLPCTCFMYIDVDLVQFVSRS